VLLFLAVGEVAADIMCPVDDTGRMMSKAYSFFAEGIELGHILHV
jgi:hypothetical protein